MLPAVEHPDSWVSRIEIMRFMANLVDGRAKCPVFYFAAFPAL